MKKLFIPALAVLLAGACSTDSKDVEPKPFINLETAEQYVGTQSPGDVWSWALDKEQGHMSATWDYGTFDDETDDITIEGTLETLPSGFLKVTISKVTPATQEIPTDGTAWFYALEVPGMAMVVKPEGSIKGDLIALVPKGECADIPGTYNYIISAPGTGRGYDSKKEEAFGYLEVVNDGTEFAFSGYKFSLDCVNGGACSETGAINGIPKATCDGAGNVVISEGGDTVAKGQFTEGGVMMMDFGYGNGGVFALKASEAATKLALKDNTYIGLAYMPTNEDNLMVPVTLSFADNGLGNMIGTGYPFSNIETNQVDENEGAVVLVENVVNGRVYGTMNFDEDNEVTEMAAALMINGTKQVLILTSYDESGSPFILFLAKQD